MRHPLLRSPAPGSTKVLNTRVVRTRRAWRSSAASPISKVVVRVSPSPSGMAATATVLDCLEKNSHVVVGDDVYGGTRRLFNLVRSQSARIEATYVDLSDAEALNGAIRPNTR